MSSRSLFEAVSTCPRWPIDPYDRVSLLIEYMYVTFRRLTGERRATRMYSEERERADLRLAEFSAISNSIQMNWQAINRLIGFHKREWVSLLARQMELLFPQQYAGMLDIEGKYVCKSVDRLLACEGLSVEEAVLVNLEAIDALMPRAEFQMPEHARLLFTQTLTLYPGSISTEYFDEAYGETTGILSVDE